MAVADLGLQLTEYQRLACDDVYGGTDGYDGLDAAEAADIDRLILRGERTFWLHPPVDGYYVWSCLHDPGLLDLWSDVAVVAATTVTATHAAGTSTVTATAASFYETMIGKSVIITTIGTFTVTGYTSSTVISVSGDATCTAKTFSIASDGTFRLPSDFESPESSTIVFTEDTAIPDIELINGKVVTALRATQDQTGYPQYAFIRWVTSDGTAAQAQELVTWPEPDAVYPVALPYMAQPQGMTTANPYPRGGPEMAHALLAVILAECEEAKNGVRGDRWVAAKSICTNAMWRDRTRHHNFIAGRMNPDAGARSQPFNVKRLVTAGSYS